MAQPSVINPDIDDKVHIKHPGVISGLASLCGINDNHWNEECNEKPNCPECIEVVKFCKALKIK